MLEDEQQMSERFSISPTAIALMNYIEAQFADHGFISSANIRCVIVQPSTAIGLAKRMEIPEGSVKAALRVLENTKYIQSRETGMYMRLADAPLASLKPSVSLPKQGGVTSTHTAERMSLELFRYVVRQLLMNCGQGTANGFVDGHQKWCYHNGLEPYL